MNQALLTLSALWLLPALGALLCLRPGLFHFPRRIAAVVAGLTLVLALLVFVTDWQQHAFQREDAALGTSIYHLGVDGLSAPLLPLTAALTLALVVAMPQAALAAGAAARVLFVEAMTLGALLSMNALLFAVFFALAPLPLVVSLRGAARRLQVVYGVAVLLMTAPLFGAVAALFFAGQSLGLAAPLDLVSLALALPQTRWEARAGLGALVTLAALARLGCAPLHAYVPVVLAPRPEIGPADARDTGDSARSIVALAVTVSPLGAFLLARVLLPLFPSFYEAAAPYLLACGLVSAVYGALLGLGQHDLRRLLGYFHVSQSGLVLAGMMAVNAVGVAGSLLHAMGSLVAMTGLFLLALSIDARAGTCDLRLLGGLTQRAPRMATGMLLLAAGAVGFPGTVGFVSEDLLVQGLLRAHGTATGVLLVVTAVNGILLYRAFKRAFLGPGAPSRVVPPESFAELLRREYWVSVALVAALIAGGFVPAPLLALRQGVAAALSRIAPDAGE